MVKHSVMKSKARQVPLDTGIGTPDRALLIDGLTSIIADCHVLEFKTRAASWNVVGPLFVGLHDLLRQQGQDLFVAVDDLARRIRALGYPAPERLSALIARSALDEEAGLVHCSAENIIGQLASDHEAITRNVRVVATWAETMNDQVTNVLLADRLQKHENAVWQLTALLT